MTSDNKKIAIIGSGISAMTTAYGLIKSGKKYDITVYQMGWRLGGKGACGRNLDPEKGYRIEEHGLHIWSGLYDNAFRVMRDAYDSIKRPKDAPLATWQQAFHKFSTLVLWEQYKGEWLPWEIEVPTNDELPGEKNASLYLSLWDYVGEALQLILKQKKHCKANNFFAQLIITFLLTPIFCATYFAILLLKFLHLFWIVRWSLVFISKIAMSIFWWAVKDNMDHQETRRAWILANTAYGNFAGLMISNAFAIGLEDLDRYDYKNWVSQYIIDDTTNGQALTLTSPFIQFMYDAQFSYIDGDLNQPDIAAGATLRTILRMAFTWKGAILWKMQAGMGDVVFTPLYEFLKKNGVKFEFFHQLRDMKLSADKRNIAELHFLQQAKLKNPTTGYQPLFDVKGLAVWPSEPFWDQLVDGEKLKLEQVNFESYCDQKGESKILSLGKEFDEVVLGTPISTLPYIAGDLIKNNPRWKIMVDEIRSVRTQGYQMWFNKTHSELGQPNPQQPVFVGYHVTPLNTLADMTFLIEHENWPKDKNQYPLSLYYLCGPMSGPKLVDTPVGPKEDCFQQNQERANQQCLNDVEKLFIDQGHVLFPKGTNPPLTKNAPLDWNYLIDNRIPKVQGKDRLNFQYYRGNVSPSERFTLTQTGKTQYRIRPYDTGYNNLFIVGDWTDNSFNMSNIEATVMSGMLASNAMCGFPQKQEIVGLGFGCSKQSRY